MEKAGQWIVFPTTKRDLNEAKTSWVAKYRIPTVIGALDCTHIQIKKPEVQFGDEYINGKNVASINVQMTCDAMERITSIDVQWPGSVHDSRIWRQSAVQQKLTRFQWNACLLGDSGYGISPSLLTPFRQPQTESERRYNRLHSKERVVIERVFGQLKQRFPILANRIRLPIRNVPKIIICCAILHNISKYLQDEFDYGIENNNDDH
ncbi:unnamed protein product [Acanthoscelides obtectus]|uniref:DDE Tnp4 domain-containing protein n=1 Tax=Acanthoscelides obtectus TaxID=200917 RepID=A0A9P0MNG3_ACAOB|nr:unnamed protein product [Acanthoscelides obtectus]CAK1627197.1 Putative nuclease HARBI1 [Acanthoscelides obtectus]